MRLDQTHLRARHARGTGVAFGAGIQPQILVIPGSRLLVHRQPAFTRRYRPAECRIESAVWMVAIQRLQVIKQRLICRITGGRARFWVFAIVTRGQVSLL